MPLAKPTWLGGEKQLYGYQARENFEKRTIQR